jgi:carboxypeptidase Q
MVPNTPRRRAGILVLAAVVTAGAFAPALLAAPAPSGGTAGAAERLIGRLLGPTPAPGDLRALCDRIGGRPTGSPANERAVDWFLDRFRAAGIAKVGTEPVPMPHRWEEGASRATLTVPVVQPLHVVAMPNSPATPAGGLEAAVVRIGEGEPADFERVGARLRGAWALLDSKVIATWEDLFGDYMRLPPIMERARVAGAVGLLVVGGRADTVLYRHVATMDLSPAPYPVAIVAREEGLRMARLAEEGDTRLRLDLDMHDGPAFEARNVVAEITGTDLKDQIIVAGAHIDSWELGTGALDNGANCVMLLDIARQMHALGLQPRRTVRFVLFNGEEQGMFGSMAYVRTHRADLTRHAAMVTVDSGTGRITGFSLGGRADLRPLAAAALQPVAGLGADAHSVDAFVGTDNFDFLLEGVPNLTANQEPSNYMVAYHASTDTFDKADLTAMRANAAITGTLIWGLANSPDRAPRQDRAAIQAPMDATGLSDQMKVYGLYADWTAGSRGRQR